MPKRIGILVGEEPAFVEALEARCRAHADVECELGLIGRVGDRYISRYDVLVDRLSPWLPHYRSYLRAAALAGVKVLNDPFAVAADDAFFGLGLAAHLGMAVPRAVLLPQHSYDSAIDPDRSLRNLEYPVDWHGLTDYVRFPCVLRSAARPERAEPVLVRDLEQLWSAFDRTGQNVTMLQQHLERATYVRAWCVGTGSVLVRGVDAEPPPFGEPHRQLPGSVSFEATGLGGGLAEQVRALATALCSAVGCELASVDFAVADGVPHVLSGPEPVPPISPELLSPAGFDQVVDALASLAVSSARGEPLRRSSYRWAEEVDRVRSSR